MSHWRRWSAVRVAVVALALTLAQALPAFGQEFVKVEDGAREQLPATPFVGVAYGFIWLAVLLYVLVVARGVASVNREIAELRRRLDRPASASAAASPRP